MKTILHAIIILAISSCSSIGKFQETNKGKGAAVISSGLLSTLINGKAMICGTLEGEEDSNLCVTHMEFNSETQTCIINMGPCEE